MSMRLRVRRSVRSTTGWRTRLHPVPDGWDVLDASVSQRLGMNVHRTLHLLVATAGRGISRREFLRRASQTALAAGLAANSLLWERQHAAADEPLETGCGPHAAGCGPSDLCPDTVCILSGTTKGYCKLSVRGVRRRVNQNDHWPGDSCGTSTAHHCWRECCSGNLKRCCDCCVPTSYCSACASCSGCTAKKKCICRRIIGTC